MLFWFTLVLSLAAGGVLALFLVTYLQERRPGRLLCLMYHRLAPRAACTALSGSEQTFTLPTEEFAAQLAELRRRGYRAVTPAEAEDFVAGRLKADEPLVLLTFDDGCVSVFREGLPLLREHGLCATIFVTTDPSSYVFGEACGFDRRMTDEELREADQGGLYVESHGVTHRPLRSLDDDELRRELVESRRPLEAIVGRPVRHLAIPGNWYDDRVLRMAKEAGYAAVWCSRPGSVRPGASLYGLPRVNVDGYMHLRAFQAQLQPWGIARRRALLWLKGLPGRLLGPRIWLPLRSVILRALPGRHLSMRHMAAVGGVALLILLLCWLQLLRTH